MFTAMVEEALIIVTGLQRLNLTVNEGVEVTNILNKIWRESEIHDGSGVRIEERLETSSGDTIWREEQLMCRVQFPSPSVVHCAEGAGAAGKSSNTSQAKQLGMGE